MDYKEGLAQISSIMEKTRIEVLDILEQYPESGILRISIKANLDATINKINFLTGIRSESRPPMKFPPITSFMGEDIIFAPKIEKVELSPDEQKRADFITKIEKWEARFLSTASDKILEMSPLDEDITVLRGVAKRAGMEDYRTAKIDKAYIDLIKEGIKINRNSELAYSEANESLSQ